MEKNGIFRIKHLGFVSDYWNWLKLLAKIPRYGSVAFSLFTHYLGKDT